MQAAQPRAGDNSEVAGRQVAAVAKNRVERGEEPAEGPWRQDEFRDLEKDYDAQLEVSDGWDTAWSDAMATQAFDEAAKANVRALKLGKILAERHERDLAAAAEEDTRKKRRLAKDDADAADQEKSQAEQEANYADFEAGNERIKNEVAVVEKVESKGTDEYQAVGSGSR